MRFPTFALAILSLAATAQANSIDFESFPGSFTSHTEQGVTFSATGGGDIITQNNPNGTLGLLGDQSPRQLIQAVIAGGATSVSVDLGDFNADPDTLILSVYDSSNTLLDSDSLLIPATLTGMRTLTASAPNIAYAVFGSTPPSQNGSSVYADNFTWTPVPEPATLTMLGIAAACFGALRYRRRSKQLTA